MVAAISMASSRPSRGMARSFAMDRISAGMVTTFWRGSQWAATGSTRLAFPRPAISSREDGRCNQDLDADRLTRFWPVWTYQRISVADEETGSQLYPKHTGFLRLTRLRWWR